MKVRVISGYLKNRTISVPKKIELFRPTMEKVRGAVADYLNDSINGAVVADLCAGSGAFGIEMVSRGAKYVYFIENNRLLCRNLKKYIQFFDIGKKCSIINKDIRKYLKTLRKKVNIIYFDPPYNDAELSEIVPELMSFITKDGIVIVERMRRSRGLFSSRSNDFFIESRNYGKTIIDFYKNNISI
ncbi:MAG: RsmD family RNA methyltransferase [Chitinispirillia bacterium]|jgi:16S rRNA (guanine(966)-N(2))-methyltransferase RsmD